MTQTTRIYGKVLYDLGVSAETVEDARKIFAESDELYEALTSPVVPLKNKRNIIDKVFRNAGFPVVFVNFLKRVCENHRMNQIREILESYDICRKEAEHIVVAKFYYVTMPEKEQIAEIEKYICKKYHAKKAEIIFEKDASLIGGFLINVNNTEYDYSMRGRLKQLKQKLTWR